MLGAYRMIAADAEKRLRMPMRSMLTVITIAIAAMAQWSGASAEVSFFSDSRGNSGTIITPGGPEGGISFYHDAFGNTGTIITPGASQGGPSFYHFSHPSGDMTSGTIQSFGHSPVPAPNHPRAFVPASPQAPHAPIAPVTPRSGIGSFGGSGAWPGR